jgi:Spy/CpxP family protein refolding chaperone
MKPAWTLVLVAVLIIPVGARAESPPAPGQDPLAAFVFPPDLVMRHAGEIGLDERQRAAVKDAVVKMQGRFLELQWDMQAESEQMARLLQASPVDEAALLAQADKVMGLEREVKRTHLSLLVRIKNLLTDAQRAKLGELRRAQVGGLPNP